MTGKAFAFGLFTSLVVFPAPLAAQNVHTSRLYEQILENIDITLPGYILDSFGVVRLTPGSNSRISLNVPANRSLEIMGDCDDDCFDLDLVVYNKAGKILAEDREDDYYPIVDFKSDDTGRIEIDLILQECEANYCYAAYSVFIGPDS
ncbi:hypothetical protein [Pelagibacterium limicola]|uniref:hypothetical protein n=1 Tax=Pelagibacterium limicola TaxID=2791022 RepID=UPI0018AF5D8E|nr:hypothetical protein [Pelagibacterium limicola]